MKNLSLTTLLIIITLGFSSCSSDDDATFLEEPSGEVFERNPAVQRNLDGSYFIDYQLKKGIGSDVVIDNTSNINEVNFFNSDNEIGRSYNEELYLNGKDQFTVGINNTINNNRSTLTIIDNDIKFNRSENQDHLEEYEITDNGDGTYTLDFSVKNNIQVDFIQNQETKAYEIHLDNGNSSESDFSRTFTKESGQELRITFINYYHNENSRTEGSSSTSNKPEVIVND